MDIIDLIKACLSIRQRYMNVNDDECSNFYTSTKAPSLYDINVLLIFHLKELMNFVDDNFVIR